MKHSNKPQRIGSDNKQPAATTTTTSLTPTDSSKLTINQMCLFLGPGRKHGCPEGAHADTWRPSKFHREAPPGSSSSNFTLPST